MATQTRLLIAGGLLAVLAGCGSTPAGQDADPTAVAGVAIDDYDEDRVICRRQRVVGSNVPVRVCKTESQMEAERAALEKQIGSLRPMTGDTRQLDVNTFPNH